MRRVWDSLKRLHWLGDRGKRRCGGENKQKKGINKKRKTTHRIEEKRKKNCWFFLHQREEIKSFSFPHTPSATTAKREENQAINGLFEKFFYGFLINSCCWWVAGAAAVGDWAYRMGNPHPAVSFRQIVPSANEVQRILPHTKRRRLETTLFIIIFKLANISSKFSIQHKWDHFHYYSYCCYFMDFFLLLFIYELHLKSLKWIQKMAIRLFFRILIYLISLWNVFISIPFAIVVFCLFFLDLLFSVFPSSSSSQSASTIIAIIISPPES